MSHARPAGRLDVSNVFLLLTLIASMPLAAQRRTGVLSTPDQNEIAAGVATTTFAVFAPVPRFRRGDCTGDGTVDISDALCILTWRFGPREAPECLAAANANGDSAVNIADATYLLYHLFAGSAAPAAPFPDCGTSDDQGDVELGCERGCDESA